MRLSSTVKIFTTVLLGTVIFLGVLLCLRVDDITVVGNSYYSEEEAKELVFSGTWSRSPLVIFYKNRTGKYGEIPFVEKYSVKLSGLTSAELILYEKNLVGYVEFMGSNLYFDRDGTVIESSKEKIENVTRVTGLEVSSVVLGRTLPLENEELLDELLAVTQFLTAQKAEVNGKTTLLMDITDRIHFNGSSQIILYLGDIAVNLGKGTLLEEKLSEMKAILPELSGMSGTLHLENYTAGSTGGVYTFD